MIAVTPKVNPGAISKGIEQFQARLRARVKPEVAESMDRAYSLAQSLVPVRTGETKRSMKKELTHGGMGYKMGFDRSAGPVPRWLEFGTRYMTARPMIQPTKDAEIPRFMAETKRAAKGR